MGTLIVLQNEGMLYEVVASSWALSLSPSSCPTNTQASYEPHVQKVHNTSPLLPSLSPLLKACSPQRIRSLCPQTPALLQEVSQGGHRQFGFGSASTHPSCDGAMESQQVD